MIKDSKKMGTKLKIHLFMNGIPQKEVARRAKINYGNFNMYLNGWLKFNDAKIKKICKAMKLDYDKYLNNEIIEISKEKNEN